MKKDVVKNLVPEVELSLGTLHSALTGAVGQRWGQKRVGMDMELGVTLRSMAGAVTAAFHLYPIFLRTVPTGQHSRAGDPQRSLGRQG